MKTLYIYLIFGFGYATGLALNRPDEGAETEDTYLKPTKIVEKYRYPVEEHVVQSDDGYLITLYRIPYGRLCSGEKSLGPVYLQHGFLSSAPDWFISGTKRSLPFILADNCYDVWIGSSRGTTYSKNHAYLDVKSAEYWDFSWHEMGQYDIPAITSYILHISKKENLVYIGHSQGTTQYFVYCSMYPTECEKKIKAAFMLAPIVYFNNSNSTLLKMIAEYYPVVGWVSKMLGMNELLPHTDFIANAGGKMCSDLHPDLEEMCANLLFVMCGYDSQELNRTMLPIYLGHMPGGAATKQLLHYGQLLKTKKFQNFDYGPDKNHQKYGQADPPQYDLSKVSAPTHLFYSANDLMAAVLDVQQISKELGNLAGSHQVSFDKFNHLDFLLAMDVVPLLYDPLLELMNQYR